jgi:hypothetical protein
VLTGIWIHGGVCPTWIIGIMKLLMYLFFRNEMHVDYYSCSTKGSKIITHREIPKETLITRQKRKFYS